MMANRWQNKWEELKRKLRELAETVDDALRPMPELVPVPIDPRRRPKRRD